MHSIASSWLRAAQAALLSQLNSATVLARHAIEGSTGALDLNAEAGRAWMARSAAATQQLMALQSSHQLLLMGREQLQSSVDHWHTYSHQAGAAGQRARLAWQATIDEEIAASRQKIDVLLDLTRQAPAALVMPINTLLQAVHAGYDQAERA